VFQSTEYSPPAVGVVSIPIVVQVLLSGEYWNLTLLIGAPEEVGDAVSVTVPLM
jgi:hypothetical protein